jgi:hypothetical protein
VYTGSIPVGAFVVERNLDSRKGTISPMSPEKQDRLVEALELVAGHLEENTRYFEAVRDRLDTITDRIDLILERGIPLEPS